jgi:hypothetical protein
MMQHSLNPAVLQEQLDEQKKDNAILRVALAEARVTIEKQKRNIESLQRIIFGEHIDA